MLLAADYKDADGKECVEVLSAPWAAPGTNVVLEGDDVNAVKPDNIEALNMIAELLFILSSKVHLILKLFF